MPRTGTHENKEERKDNYRAWLLGHRGMWAQYPGVSDEGKTHIRKSLVAAMKRDELLSKTTGWRDVPMLKQLLEELTEEQN